MTAPSPSPRPVGPPTRPVAGIILAAGQSARLGQPKQLLPLDGKPLLQHVVDAACASELDDLIVVLGAMAVTIGAALHLGRARLIVNDRYTDGQSTSILRGLDATDDRTQGALFLLGDQPAITPALINRLLARYRASDAAIVAPRYIDGIGNPVLFDRRLWPQLRGLQGDTGARQILSQRRAEISDVPIATLRLPDIDTCDDYLAAQHGYQ